MICERHNCEITVEACFRRRYRRVKSGSYSDRKYADCQDYNGNRCEQFHQFKAMLPELAEEIKAWAKKNPSPSTYVGDFGGFFVPVIYRDKIMWNEYPVVQ